MIITAVWGGAGAGNIVVAYFDGGGGGSCGDCGGSSFVVAGCTDCPSTVARLTLLYTVFLENVAYATTPSFCSQRVARFYQRCVARVIAMFATVD
jgi:hypothetical protein